MTEIAGFSGRGSGIIAMNRVALLSDNFFVLEELTVPRITEYEEI
jgi:hypothetical protein